MRSSSQFRTNNLEEVHEYTYASNELLRSTSAFFHPPSCTVGQLLQLRRSIDSRICWMFFTHELFCTSLKASHCSRIVTSLWSNWRIILQVLPGTLRFNSTEYPPGKNFTKAPQIGEIRAKASRASIQVKPPVIEAYLAGVWPWMKMKENQHRNTIPTVGWFRNPIPNHLAWLKTLMNHGIL